MDKPKVIIYQDKTINIDHRIVDLLNQWCKTFEFFWGEQEVRLSQEIIDKSCQINEDVLKETESVFFAFICTKKNIGIITFLTQRIAG